MNADATLRAEDYVDTKRYLWTLGFLIPFVPGLSILAAWQTGWTPLWFFTPFFIYVLIPIADYFIGTDSNNPPESVLTALEEDRYYRWCTFLFIPVQYTFLIFAAWLVATQGLGWLALAGLTWSIGILSGVAINTAHELGHKKPEMEKWLAKITLAPVAYGHFYVEHNKGHHRRVATPEDPASARMGENFWRFLPRTVFGSLISAWEIEKQRLERKGKGVLTWENEILQAWSMTVVLFGTLAAIFGWVVLPFLLIQAAIGASLLEAVNYVEHYGLVRQKTEGGRYERVRPEHSWNSNHIVTNIFLYHLQRHSDHHANPTRRYQALRHFDEAPQLPSGYAAMIVLAYLPPLWYKVMDPKVVDLYDGDLSKANLQPGKEEKLMARYGQPA